MGRSTLMDLSSDGMSLSILMLRKCMHTCVYGEHVCIHTYMRMHTCVYGEHVCIHTYMRMHTCVYGEHVCIHTYMRAHMHV